MAGLLRETPGSLLELSKAAGPLLILLVVVGPLSLLLGHAVDDSIDEHYTSPVPGAREKRRSAWYTQYADSSVSCDVRLDTVNSEEVRQHQAILERPPFLNTNCNSKIVNLFEHC